MVAGSFQVGLPSGSGGGGRVEGKGRGLGGGKGKREKMTEGFWGCFIKKGK